MNFCWDNICFYLPPVCDLTFTYKSNVQIMTHIKSDGLWSSSSGFLTISLNGGGGTIPLSGRWENVRTVLHG